MTMIRLDAAKLAEIHSRPGEVFLCDEAGKPIWSCQLHRAAQSGEPKYTPEEWRTIMDDPREYTTAEVLARLNSLGGK